MHCRSFELWCYDHIHKNIAGQCVKAGCDHRLSSDARLGAFSGFSIQCLSMIFIYRHDGQTPVGFVRETTQAVEGKAVNTMKLTMVTILS